MTATARQFHIGDRITLIDRTSPYAGACGVVMFTHSPACRDALVVKLDGWNRQAVFRRWQLALSDEACSMTAQLPTPATDAAILIAAREVARAYRCGITGALTTALRELVETVERADDAQLPTPDAGRGR